MRSRRLYNRFQRTGNSIVLKGKLINVSILGDCSNVRIEVGQGAVLNNTTLFIKGSNHRLKIGNNVVIKKGRISIEGDGNEIRISENTTIEDALIAATEVNSKIILGRDCMLSNNIEIRNGDSHSILQNGVRINPSGDIIIGNHVWIGSYAMILKNVSIGDNVIIGAKSLVSNSIESGNLVGGIPAKILKTDINWDRVLL